MKFRVPFTAPQGDTFFDIGRFCTVNEAFFPWLVVIVRFVGLLRDPQPQSHPEKIILLTRSCAFARLDNGSTLCYEYPLFTVALN